MCQTECIARSEGLGVFACCADHAILTIGPTSVRMDRATFEGLARLALIAHRRLILRDEHGAAWRTHAHTPDLESES